VEPIAVLANTCSAGSQSVALPANKNKKVMKLEGPMGPKQ